MIKKSRYLIILVGFISFLILAPLIVLYVRGINYDFKTHSFIYNGILAVRSEPKNVNVYLNGELKRTNAGDVSFVKAGEYKVSVQAKGYQDWNKRLAINSGQVTWANPQNNNIYLFLSEPIINTISKKVLDFSGQPGNMFYLVSGMATSQTDGYFGKTKTFEIPKALDKILTADTDNKNFILTNSGEKNNTFIYLNTDTEKLTDLSNALLGSSQISFFGTDILAIQDGNLFQINTDTKFKKILFKSVKAFYLQGQSIYYVQNNNQILSLNISQSPFTQSQLLTNNLASFEQGKLFVTLNKQIYLLADGTLYQDLGTMVSITDNVSQSNFDIQNTNFAIFHSGQFDYLDFFSSGLNLITRTGGSLKNIAVKNNIDYAFYSLDNKISSIELDTRDNQNQYVLYSGQNIQIFSIDADGKNILVLDNGELKTVKIR